ncbi:MAG: AraC family transcriptional regulator ligand-binding domain-containing protein, partial [Chromatiaceae bacterium]
MRAGPLLGIPQLLRDLGQDPTAVFAMAEVDPHLLDDPENVVPFSHVGRLLDTCTGAADCPHFGLLLGERTGLECLGLVGMLARHSPALKQALLNIVLHLHLHDRGGAPTLSVSDGEARLGYTIYQRGVMATAQICDLALGIGYNIVRTLCGASWRPRYVDLSHAKPRDPAPYRRVFGVTPFFDAEDTALVFPADWLAQPIPGADPALCRALQERVTEFSAAFFGDLPAQVRRIVCNLLRCGSGSLESAANVLSIHPRTLNRRLRRSGTTYRQLREECHHAFACQLLLDTELPIAEIAARLGYANAPT